MTVGAVELQIRAALQRLKPQATLPAGTLEKLCQKLAKLIESLDDSASDPLLAALADLDRRIATCEPSYHGSAALRATRDFLSGLPEVRLLRAKLIRNNPHSWRRLHFQIERMRLLDNNFDEEDLAAVTSRARRLKSKSANGGRKLRIEVQALTYQAAIAFYHVTGKPSGGSGAFPRLLGELFSTAGIEASPEHYAREQRALRVGILRKLG